MYLLEVYDETPVVRVRGEADVTSASEFRSALMSALERSDRRVVIDLDQCTFFDATAVGMLMGTQKKVRERLVVVAPVASPVRTALDILGIGRHVALASSLDEAFAGA